jgi:signal transduction histidine kinase
MDNSVAKAKSLVQGLLAFGKGQGARSYPVDINAIIDNMLPTIEGMVGENITFEIMMPDKPLVVMADSVQMKQVVLNLVANARDAMPDGGNMTITLDEVSEARDSCIPRSGSFALVLIGDNGQGIDDKIKERIFEPFFTTKEVGKGTGLGLSIVYGIVEQHHGHICVNSKPGGGTEFRVYIPLAEVSDGPVQDIAVGG